MPRKLYTHFLIFTGLFEFVEKRETIVEGFSKLMRTRVGKGWQAQGIKMQIGKQWREVLMVNAFRQFLRTLLEKQTELYPRDLD